MIVAWLWPRQSQSPEELVTEHVDWTVEQVSPKFPPVGTTNVTVQTPSFSTAPLFSMRVLAQKRDVAIFWPQLIAVSPVLVTQEQ
jgi:hypothetical protein